jgi:excisionase family DNA binding protein
MLAMDKLDGYLRIREAAEFLGVSPNTLRNWGRKDKIPEFRHPVNNYRLYRRSDLEELLRTATRSRRVGNGRRRKAKR